MICTMGKKKLTALVHLQYNMKTEKFRNSFVPYCLKHYDQHSCCELHITYKLLSQTLDISSRFLQHFAILLYIVLIQLFAAGTNKPLLYNYYISFSDDYTTAGGVVVLRQSVGLAIKRLWTRGSVGHYSVKTGNFLTPMCLCHQAV